MLARIKPGVTREEAAAHYAGAFAASVEEQIYSNVKKEAGHPHVCYTPWPQNRFGVPYMTFYVRSALPPVRLFAQVREAVRAVDADIPLEDLRTVGDQVRLSIAGDRQTFQLAGFIAVLITALAMMGLYGVMAYSVVRRTREIGIRMAIGAKPAGIRKMVMREMLLIMAVGLVLGIPAALAISKLAESRLFGVSAYDPFVLACASLALGLAAFAATFLPAWRASRIDPLRALRCE